MIKPFYKNERITLYHGDALETIYQLRACSIDCVISSPPVLSGNYVSKLFPQLFRICKKEATMWLNFNEIHSYLNVPHAEMAMTDVMREMVTIGCPPGGIIIDPFMGNGNTGHSAIFNKRQFIGIDSNKAMLERFVSRHGYIGD